MTRPIMSTITMPDELSGDETSAYHSAYTRNFTANSPVYNICVIFVQNLIFFINHLFSSDMIGLGALPSRPTFLKLRNAVKSLE